MRRGRQAALPPSDSNSHLPPRREPIKERAGRAAGRAGSCSSEGRGAPGAVGGRDSVSRGAARRLLTAGPGRRGWGRERAPHRGGGAAPAAMDSRVSELFGGCCRPAGGGAGGPLRGRGGTAPGGGGSKAKKKNGRSRGGKANNPPYLPPEVSSAGRASGRRIPSAAEEASPGPGPGAAGARAALVRAGQGPGG